MVSIPIARSFRGMRKSDFRNPLYVDLCGRRTEPFQRPMFSPNARRRSTARAYLFPSDSNINPQADIMTAGLTICKMSCAVELCPGGNAQESMVREQAIAGRWFTTG